MTPEQKVARLKRLVSAARSFVAGQQGITTGVNHILACLYNLGDEWVEKYPVFSDFRQAIPAELPIGSERLLWNLERIIELDPILAKIEQEYRAKLMNECCGLIGKYSE
ncbi:hypothetical protein [Aliamphritea ceti]|uniref:hypothetical protein n=1 Tax=Aliamphritea ceti TaxID=1524258 RepID=UPI0021C37324|nr:hypothetical protein [Aliamphritea ceti]